MLAATLGGGLLGWTGCGSPEVPSAGGPSEDPTRASPQPKSTTTRSHPGPGKKLPTSHADFAHHFTDPIYRDVNDELAPFGSDEGSDVLHRWKDRRDELRRCPTLRKMVGADEASLEDLTKAHAPDLDRLLTGYGFTLLLLTGRIDSEGKGTVLDALRRNQKHYAKDAPRALQLMVRDLESFASTDC